MSGHSPGPWNAYPTTDGGANVRGRGSTVCEVVPQEPGIGLANAHVIAAAPQLLDALAGFVEGWRRAWRENAEGVLEERIRLEVTLEQFRMAEVALAKARGGR